jgi:diguanylate cyclase (GGDEF)-like protein
VLDRATAEKGSRADGQRTGVLLVLILVATYYVVSLIVGELIAADRLLMRVTLQLGILVVVTSGLLWGLLIRPLRADRDAERARTADREMQLMADGHRQEWQARLHRAMEMAHTESGAYRVVERVLRSVVATGSSELLVADASDAHLERVVTVAAAGSPIGCDVPRPQDCPAVRRAQPQVFQDSEEFDACPYMRGCATSSVSAVCVPVNIMGRAVGVIHAQGPVGRAPEYAIPNLEMLADHAGTRIGMLRVMEQTSLQASTDPLTGLLNRRSLENATQPLLDQGRQFALAMGDLDHFKQLNDVHGHEVGDRALRLFAQALKGSLREEDLVCRFGGEEFVVVFPDLEPDLAANALDRVREELLIAIARGTVPGFTVSFGLASSGCALRLDDIIREADMALMKAKREGRDRVVLAAA